MKITKGQLRRIIKEEYNKILTESVPHSQLPWFIHQFIDDYGTYFDNTELTDPKNRNRYIVEFYGGSPNMNSYAFTKVRVAYFPAGGTWDDDLAPTRGKQMIYSLPYRGYLPTKKTKDPKKAQISRNLLQQYRAEIAAAGIKEARTNSERRAASRVPMALHDY